MVEENRAPQLWPLALVLGVLLWIFTMTGGRQVFVNEMLSEAYDSQAEHLLKGDPGVDGEAIRHEVMIVNGKTRMYFGPFPAFVRIPLNYVYPAGRGNWSRLCGFCPIAAGESFHLRWWRPPLSSIRSRPVSWLVEADMNVPWESRIKWIQFLGRASGR